MFNLKRKKMYCLVLNKKYIFSFLQASAWPLLDRVRVMQYNLKDWDIKVVGTSPKQLGRAMFREEYNDVQFVSILIQCLLIKRLITATCAAKDQARSCATNNFNDGSVSLSFLAFTFCSQSKSLLRLRLSSLITPSKEEQGGGEVIEARDLFKVNHSGNCKFYCGIFSSHPSSPSGCVHTVQLQQKAGVRNSTFDQERDAVIWTEPQDEDCNTMFCSGVA